MGVLVAVSIPIFTSQLKKARLATNQANGRAAYAAVVAELLDAKKDTGKATYSVATAKIGAVTSAATGTTTAAPQNWKYSGTATSKEWKESQLGSATAKAWTVSIATDGTVSYTPTW